MVKDEKAEFSVMNVIKGAALGAATGGVGHITGNVVNHVDSGFVRSIAKVGVDTAGTVAVDGTCQLIADGSIDSKNLILNASAKAATSAGHEAVKNATYAYHGGKDALCDKLGDKKMLENVGRKDKKEIRKAKEFLKQQPSEKIEDQVKIATQSSSAKKELHRLEDDLAKLESSKAQANNEIIKVKNDVSLSREERRAAMEQLQQKKDKLERQIKIAGRTLNNYNKEVLGNQQEPAKMGAQNVHALDGEHIGQFAADLPEDGNNNGRGARRVVFDAKTKRGSGIRFKIAGIIDDHDYNKVPKYGEVEVPELMDVKPLVLPKSKDDDKDEDH